MSLEEATDQLKDMGQMLQRQVHELCSQVGRFGLHVVHVPAPHVSPFLSLDRLEMALFNGQGVAR